MNHAYTRLERWDGQWAHFLREIFPTNRMPLDRDATDNVAAASGDDSRSGASRDDPRSGASGGALEFHTTLTVHVCWRRPSQTLSSVLDCQTLHVLTVLGLPLSPDSSADAVFRLPRCSGSPESTLSTVQDLQSVHCSRSPESRLSTVQDLQSPRCPLFTVSRAGGGRPR